jgi:hypothetical protein
MAGADSLRFTVASADGSPGGVAVAKGASAIGDAERVPSVRLVDSDGEPVAGAWLGVGAHGDSDSMPVWSPYSPKGISNESGGGRRQRDGWCSMPGTNERIWRHSRPFHVKSC